MHHQQYHGPQTLILLLYICVYIPIFLNQYICIHVRRQEQPQPRHASSEISATNWRFTLRSFNLADGEMGFHQQLLSLAGYYCYGESIAHGNLHLQGYIQLKQGARGLSGMTMLHPKAHWEPAEGTDEEEKAKVKDAAHRFKECGTLNISNEGRRAPGQD